MIEKTNRIMFKLFSVICVLFTILITLQSDVLYAAENDNSVLIKKVSKSYTKKFCNAIGFGLSKESAMDFSLLENRQVFKKKGIDSINKELLAEEIATNVVEKCGYPINLSGSKGILEFKNYYLSKDL